MPKSVRLLTLDGNPLALKSGEDSVCILKVSVGQPYYREDPLRFAIQAFNESAFTKIIFVVRGVSPDTLQLEGKTEEKANSLSRQSELEWFTGTSDSVETEGVDGSARYFPDLATHLKIDLGDYETRVPALVQLTKPYEIKLWDEILSSSLYRETDTRLRQQYKDEEELISFASRSLRSAVKQSSSFYRAVTEAATAFLAAYASNHKPRLTPEQLKRLGKDEYGLGLCVNHILVERAGDPVLAEYGDFLAYPFSCTASDLKLTTLVTQTLSGIGKKMELLDIRFDGFPELLIRNPKPPKPEPEDQATSSEPRKKPAELVKEGDSQETESARGCLEGTEKHLKELTVDPGTSSAECPEELLSPDAQEHQVQEFLLRANSVARKLGAPYRMRFAVGLTIVAGKYLSEGYSPGFDFAPKKFDAAPVATDLPATNPCK